MADLQQLQPGMTATRSAIKNIFGGSTQGGIVPSNSSNTVLLFSDPAVGRRYGYHDGWLPDEDPEGPIFEYTGAGALGDQTFDGGSGSGNRAILNHVAAGRSLRVFTATGTAPGSQAKLHRYIGEFKVDERQPYVLREMPDTDGNLRNVFVFRLRPAGAVDRIEADTASTPVGTLASLHSDSLSVDDLLDNRTEVDRLAKVVSARSTVPPLAIAVLGEWGAGKSSFMAQMEQRITQIADLSALAASSDSAFVSHVRQIRFNAWNYSDENIWPGLIGELFRGLARMPEKESPTPASVDNERARCRKEVDTLKDQYTEIANALAEGDEARSEGLISWIRSPAEITPLIRPKVRELRGALTFSTLLFIAVLATTVAALVWGRDLIQPEISATFGALIGVVPVVRIKNIALKIFATIGSTTEASRSGLEQRLKNLEADIITADARLAEVDAAVRLAQLLKETSNSYREHQGLLAQVHKDLNLLDETLQAARKQWTGARAHNANNQPPLQRIILYVDDLDRCPPTRVADVLAAVNLMLALPLFVVVVAVDPRWLVRCLKHHYKELFSESAQPEAKMLEDIVTPLGYLDKIFQIPFTVPPVTPEKTALLLNALLDVPKPSTSASATERTSNSEAPLPSDNEAPAGDEEEKEPGTSSPKVSDTTSPPSDELNPGQILLTDAENAFMPKLGALLPTPRAAKKLVNLYRLVRIGVESENLGEFIHPETGEYQVVQFLLALLVGHPEQSGAIFDHILEHPSSSENVATVRFSPNVTISDLIAETVNSIKSTNTVHLGIDTLQKWIPIVARYSFYTRRLSS
ncbi:P-loop NTPase fold protein [Streptomyces sp. NPDC090306]|uniref:P-loop NTPase fold protein n=1 Tax=Streptomyces sp. NPDC090306 TaxID=3365961 RepID=UPI003828F8FD